MPSNVDARLVMVANTGNSRDYTQAGKKFCRYYKKEGHILDECRKLKWKKQQEQNAQSTSNSTPNHFAGAVDQQQNPTVAAALSLSNAELTQLKQLLQAVQQAKPTISGSGIPTLPNDSGKYTLSAGSCPDSADL